MHGARAERAGEHEQRDDQAVAEALQPGEALAGVDEVAEGDDRRDRGERQRGEDARRGRGRARPPRRRARRPRRAGRAEFGVPRLVASPSGRTILPRADSSEVDRRPWHLSPGSATRRSSSSSDEGKRIYVDPLLTGNPKTPESEKQPDQVDIIAITHGHSDHVGDTVALSKAFPEAQIVCQVELKGWLGAQGANVADQLPGPEQGRHRRRSTGSTSRSSTRSTRRARTTASTSARPAGS